MRTAADDAGARIKRDFTRDGVKGRHKRERELDEEGKVVRDDALFEDGSRKAYATPR